MRIETSIVVDRPIEEVWAFMMDPFNLPRYGGTWLGVRQTSAGPMGLGSTGQGRWVLFGFEARIGLAITEWNPPHTATLSVKGAGMRSASLRGILEVIAGGTKVMRVAEFEPRPAFKPLYWIAGPLIRRRAQATDRKLKRLLESSAQ